EPATLAVRSQACKYDKGYRGAATGPSGSGHGRPGSGGGAARERLSYDRPPGRSREALEKRAKHAVPPPPGLPALESRARAGATAEAAAPARLPGAMGAAVDRRARAPRPSPSDQRCRKSGLRFSTKAAIPSFWSSVANS